MPRKNARPAAKKAALKRKQAASQSNTKRRRNRVLVIDTPHSSAGKLALMAHHMDLIGMRDD